MAFDIKLGEVGGVFTSIREAITGKKIEDPIELLRQVNEVESKFLQAQSSIIVAEAQSEHWIVAAWRPITMMVFVFIIFSNYILFPYANAFGLAIPYLDIPDKLWDLIQIGMGGYVLSRGAEKVSKNWKG